MSHSTTLTPNYLFPLEDVAPGVLCWINVIF